MSAMSQPNRLSTAGNRRPFMLLVAALVLLAAVLLYRSFYSTGRVTQPAAPVALERSAPAAAIQAREKAGRNPQDPSALAELGLTLLQQVRLSGDNTLYAEAGQAFDQALASDPKQLYALVGKGVLALSLHDFEGAMQWAEQAQAVNPFRAEILGIQVDSLVERGQYDKAVATLQKMVDLRPDLQSYSRVSYLRELNGDVAGAIKAMEMAANSAPVGSEEWLWTMTHLGNLYLNKGELTSAQQLYTQVLQIKADYPYALTGAARVQAAQGDLLAAINTLKPVVDRLPLPEFVTALGEFYEAQGDQQAAQRQYELVGVMQQLNAAAGMNVDLEMALFNANHGADRGKTLEQARLAFSERPTIYGADTLAWALYGQGDYAQAQKYSQEALRLGTQDATLYFHAGLIAAALGDNAAARQQLAKALEINPAFSPLYAPQAQAKLKELGQ